MIHIFSRFRIAFALFVGLAGCFCSAAQAQNLPGITSGPVSVLSVEPVTVTQGHEAPIEITVHIQEGYHINSNKPMSRELKPTQLHVDLPDSLILTKTKYPIGKMTDSPFEPPGEKLSLYSGDVTIRTMVLARAKSMLGGYTVHADLTYQACDNRSCYPPKTVPFEFMVNVVRAPREH